MYEQNNYKVKRTINLFKERWKSYKIVLKRFSMSSDK